MSPLCLFVPLLQVHQEPMTARDHPERMRPAEKLVSYLTVSPTPYHAVHNAAKRLEAAGFQRLSERSHWDLKPNGRYFTTRNQSSLIAFALPKSYKPSFTSGMAIIGTHTDSCNFKLRPVSKRSAPAGTNYMAIGVETYGGGLWHTWLDRDLGIAGRVITASKDSAGKATYTPHLIHLNKPLVRIPTVAIHLDRNQNEKFFYNQESGMQAILGLISDQTNASAAAKNETALDTRAHHHPRLLELIAEELSTTTSTSIKVEDLHDFDLSLVDSQAPTLGGANDEFIFSARLDNLFSTFCAVEGLADSLKTGSGSDVYGEAARVIAMWDNEEIGSVSAYGAESNLLESVMQKIVGDAKVYEQAIANSYLLSCDMGHAMHPAPDHSGKHQNEHRPLMNKGPMIKSNAKIRYATTAPTTFILRQVATKAGVPLQELSMRNDMPCGSTVGALVSKLGLRTVDIGCAQLSMHSVRETGGAEDVGMLIKLFEAFFEHYSEADKALVMDE